MLVFILLDEVAIISNFVFTESYFHLFTIKFLLINFLS